jgi:chloride channel protein, CIC family
MGAVLAAVIQAPLMAILLLFEVTRKYQIMLPIMLTAVIATIMYQVVVGEGLYTLPLRARGIRVDSAAGISMLQRIGLEELELAAPSTIEAGLPVAELVARSQADPHGDFVVVDPAARYLGVFTAADLHDVLLQPEAMPLLLAGDVCRSDVPPLQITDTLAMALDLFARHEVSSLAVLRRQPQERLVVMFTRAEAMKQYHAALG